MKRESFEKFAVKYWGTKTLYVGGVGLQVVGKGGWNLKHPDFYLQLRSIDSLTEDETNEIADIIESHYPEHFIEAVKKGTQYAIRWEKSLKVIDYLRSIGVLVPSDGYTVEEIISMGWAKI